MQIPPTHLPKSSLVDGVYYIGLCRHGRIARWDSRRQAFHYWRTKWGRDFVEVIEHPEDDQVWDVFVPIAACPDSQVRAIPPPGWRHELTSMEHFELNEGD